MGKNILDYIIKPNGRLTLFRFAGGKIFKKKDKMFSEQVC